MTSKEINKYITEAYNRLLDFSKYHCSHQSMDDESVDVLNEVLAMLIEKNKANPEYVTRLYESKKGLYSELDFFVLQMIKLNIQSPTSPYRHKYKPIPVDANIDFQMLDLEDLEDIEIDRNAIILSEMQQVRSVFDKLQLSKKASRIFSFKFFEGNSFSEWDGPEEKKELYDTYNGVIELIKNKLNNRELF